MSIAKAGDQVILPRPHYFNHDMWMRMQGVEPVSLDFRPGSGAVPNAGGCREADRAAHPRHHPDLAQQPDRRGLSARHHPRLLRARADATASPCCSTRPTRISCPQGGGRTTLFSQPDWRGTLVHLYSFSKVFALTGYRVGGVTAGAALMAEIEKAMDCVSICPPRLGQEAALYGLQQPAAVGAQQHRGPEGARRHAGQRSGALQPLAPRQHRRLLRLRRAPLRWHPSTAVSKRLADEENLLTIPATCSARAGSASSASPSPTSPTTRSRRCWSGWSGLARRPGA